MLKRVLRQSLKRIRKPTWTASTAEAFLVNWKLEKAYGVIRGWYKTCSKKPPKPTFWDEEVTRCEYEILFKDEEPKCNPIPIIYNPPEGIDDQPPNKGEIVAVLKKLKLGKSPGALGIRVEDLREWHPLAPEKSRKNQERGWGTIIRRRGDLGKGARVGEHCAGVLPWGSSTDS